MDRSPASTAIQGIPRSLNSSTPRLSLDALERHDPHQHASGDERRYRCPLPACNDHQRKRNLSANVDTGAWHCWCCEARGLLLEFRGDRPRPLRRPAPRVTTPPPRPAPQPAVVSKQRVGDVRRWRGQNAAGVVRGLQCRQDLRVTRADGTVEPDKQPWWEVPDGRPSKGEIHAAELVYVVGDTPLPTIPDGATVLVVEGPATADAVQPLVPAGWYVIALLGGASTTPAAAILDQLARFRCWLSPDNDSHHKGQALMRRVAAGLLERAAAVRWVPPLGDGGGYDFADYARDGATPDDVAAILAAARGAYAEVVAALEAQHAAALGACQARTQAAEQETATVRAHHSAILQVYARKELPMVDKGTLVGTMLYAAQYREQAAPAAAPPPRKVAALLADGYEVLPPLQSIGSNIGCGRDAVRRVLHKYADLGGYDVRVESYPTARVDRETGEICAKASERTLIRWGSDGAATGVIARLATTPIADHLKLKRQGGTRTPDARCEHCGGKLTWHQVLACNACGQSPNGENRQPVAKSSLRHFATVKTAVVLPPDHSTSTGYSTAANCHSEEFAPNPALDSMPTPVSVVAHCATCRVALRAGERERCAMCEARQAEAALYAALATVAMPAPVPEPAPPERPPAITDAAGYCGVHHRALLMYAEQRHHDATGEWRCETCAKEHGGVPLVGVAP